MRLDKRLTSGQRTAAHPSRRTCAAQPSAAIGRRALGTASHSIVPRRSTRVIGRRVLSGFLSVTTATLLNPVATTRTRAWAEEQVQELPQGDQGDVPVGPGLEDDEPSVTWDVRLGDVGLASGGRYESGSMTVVLRSSDDLAGVVTLDVDGDLRTLGLEGREDGLFEAHATLEHGAYGLIRMSVVGEGGESSEVAFEHVVVDAVAPRYGVAWDSEPAGVMHDGVTYCPKTCALTLTVDDVDPTDELRAFLNGEPVEPRLLDGARAYDVPLLRDGSYEVRLEGVDAFGREATWSGEGPELPLRLVVDTQPPEARVLVDGRVLDEDDLHDGRLYLQQRPDVVVEVSDANLDVESLRVGGVAYEGWQRSGDLWRLELPEDVALDEPLAVTGADWAGNRVEPGAFVVPVTIDVEAPAIEAEHLSPDSVATDDDEGRLASLFFARETSLRLFVGDDAGLARIEVEPDDACDVDLGSFVPGDTDVTLTLALREGVEFTREVVVRASDLAGNWRTWSLAEEGVTCEAGVENAHANAEVYVDAQMRPVHPLALLLDATAPSVDVRGVEEGEAYACPCEVVVSVDEASFAHLQRHGGASYADQVVASWTLENPRAGDQEEACDAALRVRDFEHNDVTGRWEATLRLAKDGDYTLRAQVTDVAGNESNEVVRHFTIDATPPVCEVLFACDEKHPEEHERRYYRTPRLATVRVREHNWDAMRELNVRYVTEDGQVYSVDPTRFASVGDDWYECDVAFERDDSYSLVVDAVDVAGNRMEQFVVPTFVIDTTSPTIRVAYSGESVRHGRYYNAARTATITVVEHNWGSDDRFVVEVRTRDAAQGYEPRVSAWKVPNAKRPDEHVCTVAFERDGAYELRVHGRDLAGHDAVSGQDVGFGDSFVIDLEPPAVDVGFSPSSYTTFGGVKYVRSALEVPVRVRDRNLDVEATTLAWDGRTLQGDERIGWTRSKPDSTGEVWRETTVRFTHGRHVSPAVDACDLAGNRTQIEGEPFVVDLEAPRIVGVSTTTAPVAAYEGEVANERGEVQFFGQATRIVFEVSDEFGIDGVSLYDPDGEYSIGEGVERGCSEARVSVELAQDGASHAADAFERNIVFEVADVAGNRRSWTLNRAGEVVAEQVSEGEDPALNGAGEPAALVYDGIAPQVSIAGVSSGTVSNETQVARVAVDERNFSYLQAFRPSEVVVRITLHDASPSRSEHVEEVRVGGFSGEDPSWSYEHPFAADGHYSICASFADVANHPSNRVEVGEFTIDKTPPVIQVSWDHDLGEANSVAGTHYFRTTREATVTVREHNFREGDYAIDAGVTGVVGPWHDAGDDAHACVVSYDAEAKDCRLVVSGKDEAGNVAEPYEQRGFVIDLTPPTVQVIDAQGPNGERAFAGDLSPTIVFDDGASGNFDASVAGWSYELRGMREANEASRGDTGRFGQREQVSEGGASVTFANMGMRDDADAFDVGYDDVYTLTATVRDLAGNVGTPASVSFSLNRFGSNFFVESGPGLEGQGTGATNVDATQPLAVAPTIVVHEVNVSGARSEADHSVIRDYANSPEELVQDEQGKQFSANDAGYSLSAASEPSDYNAYGGWAEYVYTIRSGNFGEGAIGEGDGQGLYRVNVGSIDAASNANTTMRYWGSDSGRNEAADKSATVAFTLDELPPVIDDLDARQGVVFGAEHAVAFHVTDDISCGDDVEVLVDGEPVEVRAAGSDEPVDANAITTGTYAFTVPSRAFAPHSISVRVEDYNGRVARRAGTLYVSTFVAEASLVVALVAAGVVAHVAWRRRKDAEEPAYPQVV